MSKNLMMINYKRRGRKWSWYNFKYLGMCQNWKRIGSTLVRITVIRNRHLKSKCQKRYGVSKLARFPTFIEPATLYHDHSLPLDPALSEKNLVHVFVHNILYILILSSYLPLLHTCGHLTQVCREKNVWGYAFLIPLPEKYKNKKGSRRWFYIEIVSLAFSVPSFSPNRDGQEIDRMVLRNFEEISLLFWQSLQMHAA